VNTRRSRPASPNSSTTSTHHRPDPLEVIARFNALFDTSRTVTALLAQVLVEFTTAAAELLDTPPDSPATTSE
jgi:hypothetical protein